MSRAWLACAAATALAACAGPREAEPASAPATAAVPDDSATSVAADDSASPATGPSATAVVPDPLSLRLRGNAVMGKDGYGLVPCGESAQRIVFFETSAKAMLDAFLAGGAHEFFLDGWAVEAADGKTLLTRIERIYTEGPGCDETLGGVAFVARGTEPFWSVRAGMDGVILERPAQAPLTAEFTGVREQAGERVIEATTSEGALSLRLTPGRCSDGMSDTVFGWTAQLSLGDQAFRGCAYAGLPADRN